MTRSPRVTSTSMITIRADSWAGVGRSTTTRARSSTGTERPR